MEEEEIQQESWLWSRVEQMWGITGTLAVVAVLGGALGRGVMQMFHLDSLPANVVCCMGMTNPAEPQPPQPLGVLGKGVNPAVAHVKMLKDAQGRTVEARFVDGDGKLHALPGSKVSRQVVEYDESGRVVRRRNLNAAGKPVADAAGVAVREFAYDGAGKLVRRSYRGEDGLPTSAHPTTIAEQRMTYDSKGRPLLVRNLGDNGLSKPDSGGEETVRFEYNDETGEETRRNFIHDLPANNESGVAVQRIVRDKDGQEVRCEWLDAAGNPIARDAGGVASVVREYHPLSRIHRRVRLGADGKPVSAASGWTEYLARYTSNGLPEWECYTGEDGLPMDNPATGYAEKVSLYSRDGSKAYEYFWKADGSHADCCEKRYARSPDGQAYCLRLHADGSSAVAPVADNI